MPLTQGAKIFLGAGALGAAYMATMRRASSHAGAGHDEAWSYERQEYKPKFGRLPATTYEVERKDTAQGPIHIVPSDRINVGTESTAAMPPMGTTAAMWEKQKARGGLDAVPRGNVNGTDMGLEARRMRPAEYVEREGLGERGSAGAADRRMGTTAPASPSASGSAGVLDRMAEVKDVVKEHAKAAVEDVGQAASEVGRVISEHGRQAGRDVAGATNEVARAVTDSKPLGEVRVRDTPDLLRPEAGRGQLDAVRKVPVGSSSTTASSSSRSTTSMAERGYDAGERPYAGGSGSTSFRDRAYETGDRMGQRAAGAAGSVKGAGEALADSTKNAASTLREGAHNAGEALREAGREARDAVTGGSPRMGRDSTAYTSRTDSMARGTSTGASTGMSGSGSSGTTRRMASERFIPMPGTGAPSIMGGFEEDHHTEVTTAPGMGMRTRTGGDSGTTAASGTYPSGRGSGDYGYPARDSSAPMRDSSGSTSYSATRGGESSYQYKASPTGGESSYQYKASPTGGESSYQYKSSYGSTGSGSGGMGGPYTASASQPSGMAAADSGSMGSGSAHVTRYYGDVPATATDGHHHHPSLRGAAERVEDRGEIARVRAEGALDRGRERAEGALDRGRERAEGALERGRERSEELAERVRRDAAAARDSVRSAEDAAAARMRRDAQGLKDSFAQAERSGEERVRRDAEAVRERAAAASGRIAARAENARDTLSSAAQHVKEDVSAVAGHAKRDAQAAGGTVKDAVTGESGSGSGASSRYSSSYAAESYNKPQPAWGMNSGLNLGSSSSSASGSGTGSSRMA